MRLAAAISALRDLTRTRVALIQTRSQAKHQVTTALEGTHSKLSRVGADLFGVGGRQRRTALSAGERGPQALAGPFFMRSSTAASLLLRLFCYTQTTVH